MAELSIKEDKTANAAELSISKDFVLEEVSDIKTKLQAVSDKYSRLHVIIADVTQIDMAALQLLPALQKKMQANEKHVSFSFETDDGKLQMIKRAGLLYLTDNLKK